MLLRRVATVAAVALACSSPPASAERPQQGKEEASLVVTGTVEGVYSETSPFLDQFIVPIRVETVDAQLKSFSVKPGDVVYAYSFHARLQPGFVGAGGHVPPPVPNRQIRAYLSGIPGQRLEGIYPLWYEQHGPARLGIIPQDIPWEGATRVRIAQVERGGLAEAAGLRGGDVILKIGGVYVLSTSRLRDALSQCDGPTPITYLRGGNGPEIVVPVAFPKMPPFGPVPRLRDMSQAS